MMPSYWRSDAEQARHIALWWPVERLVRDLQSRGFRVVRLFTTLDHYKLLKMSVLVDMRSPKPFIHDTLTYEEIPVCVRYDNGSIQC